MRLLPLDPRQRRALVVEDFDDEAAADHFLTMLGSVRDLIGLAENPRMLSFMIRWYRDGLLTQENLRRRRTDHRRAAVRPTADDVART